MKGKILSVLFSLMLIFGMIIVSCDNPDIIKDPTSDDGKNVVLDFSGDSYDLLTPAP
jgi:hypothetical protein